MFRSVARFVAVDHPDEDIRRRGRMLAIVALGMLGVATGIALLGLISGDLISLGIFPAALIIYGGPLLLARRGYVTLGGAIIITSIILVMLANLSAPPLLGSGYFLVLPMLVAGLVLRPHNIWLVLVLVLVAFAIMITVFLGHTPPRLPGRS
jgi:rsbT co-antagonist protein RsbR